MNVDGCVIILCTIPVIAGNGCRLFLGDLPESEWMRDETKTYKDGSLKAVYRKNEGATVQKVNTSRLNARSHHKGRFADHP